MAENMEHELSREELEDKVGQLEARIAELESELAERSTAEAPSARRRRRFQARFRIFCTISASLLVAAATVVLITNYAFPILSIYGSSMSTTVADGDIVIGYRTTNLKYGDICAFYYGNRILCKRVIGLSGDVIEMDEDGNVSVNGEELEEPYLLGKSVGLCDIEFPYTVPSDCFFVLGDNRRSSIDSRNAIMGCVSEDQIVGKLVYRILPIPSIGKIE